VAERAPMQPFVFKGMVAIPLHHTGFGNDAHMLIRRWLDNDLILTLYGHPNQALSANGQNANELDRLLSDLRPARDVGKLEFNTMGEIAALTCRGRIESRTEMLVSMPAGRDITSPRC
jgi:hypothetical protein